MLRRDLRNVVASEPVGPYCAPARRAGRPRAGHSGPVLHARSAGPCAAAADEPRWPRRRARLPLPGDRARHQTPRSSSRATASGSSARWGTASGWTSTGRCWSEGGSASRRSVPLPGPRPARRDPRLRTRHHAEAAELVPNAEVVEGRRAGDRAARAGLRRARLRPPRCSRPCVSWRRGPAGLGGAHGLRVRRLLRLRRRDRRALQAPMPGGPRPCCSNVRDASMRWPPPTWPAHWRLRHEDRPPEPREGNEPRIAETDHGMLNSIDLQNPGANGSWTRCSRGCGRWASRSGSRSGFAADEYAETCARLDDVLIELISRARTSTRRPNRQRRSSQPAARRPAPIYAKLSPAQPDMADGPRRGGGGR